MDNYLYTTLLYDPLINHIGMLSRLVQALHLYSVPAKTTCDGLFYFTQGFQNLFFGKIVKNWKDCLGFDAMNAIDKIATLKKNGKNVGIFCVFFKNGTVENVPSKKMSKIFPKQLFFLFLCQNGNGSYVKLAKG